MLPTLAATFLVVLAVTLFLTAKCQCQLRRKLVEYVLIAVFVLLVAGIALIAFGPRSAAASVQLPTNLLSR